MGQNRDAKIATFGKPKSLTELRGCPECETRYSIKAGWRRAGEDFEPPNDDPATCPECGTKLEIAPPGNYEDRCERCGDWHRNDDEYCSEECREAEKTSCEECGTEIYPEIHGIEREGTLLCRRCDHGRAMAERYRGENQR